MSKTPASTPHAVVDLTPPPGQGVLLAVNVGRPRNHEWNGRTVYTGIWKYPVDGPVMVRRLNLDGDGQGDTAGHGGEQRAVMVYQLESYRHWEDHFARTDLEWGQFGENFTIAGLPDDEVCIGDRYRIGAAEFEVTQPRVTCFRVGMRLGSPDLPNLLVAHHRPGFYFRVITEGLVRSGDRIELVRRGPHALSVAETDALLYLPDPEPERLRQATDIAALSPGWQQSFRGMVRERDDGDAVSPRPIGVEPGWQGFRPLTVTEIVRQTSTVVSVRLAAPDAAPLPAPRPGQFLTVRLPGAGDPPLVRSYSLSDTPSSNAYRISVKREPHGRASSWLHENLTVGAIIEAAAPRGDFCLDEESPDAVVLVSAGIGVTPVLAMLHQLARQRTNRAVWWLHGTRNADQHAFADEVRGLLGELPHAHEHVFYSAGSSPDPTVSAGRLTPEAVQTLAVPSRSDVYICGPDVFMSSMRQAFSNLGVDPRRIHSELFATLAPINPGIVGARPATPHLPPGPVGPGPAITFARSGLTVAWDRRRYQSLLELAEACDVPTRWSCRSGVCHTCVTPLLTGSVRYAPPPLLEAPTGEILICCTTPDEDLVLDL